MVPHSSEREFPASADGGRIDLAPGVWIDKAALGWSFVRSSGPGGQNVNKVSTKAELRVPLASISGLDEPAMARLRDLAGSRLVGDGQTILIQCDESRSQRRNRDGALDRLRELVGRAAVSPKVRRRRRPTRAMIERRLERKRRQAQRKDRRHWKPE